MIPKLAKKRLRNNLIKQRMKNFSSRDRITIRVSTGLRTQMENDHRERDEAEYLNTMDEIWGQNRERKQKTQMG